MRRSELAVITTHISPALGYGGPAVSVAVLIKAWARMGHKLEVSSSDASEEQALTYQDVDLGRNVGISLYPTYWFKRWGFGLKAISHIFGTCRRAPFVYINGVATWPTTLAALICWVLKIRFVVSLRGGLMPEHIYEIKHKKIHKWLYYRLLTLPTLRRAAAIHCTSTVESKSARRILGRRNGIILLPNGIDTQKIKAIPMPSYAGLMFCYVGRISREKGINAFVRLWLERRKENEKFFVAGSGYGDYFTQFKEIVRQSEGAVVYKGYLNRAGVMNMINNIHILVLPSGLEGTNVRENFGNTIVEAFALGRPVMAARGLAWDYIEDKHLGFVFERSTSSAREALARVQNTSIHGLQQMGAAARRYAEENLDSNSIAERLWEAITSAIPHLTPNAGQKGVTW